MATGARQLDVSSFPEYFCDILKVFFKSRFLLSFTLAVFLKNDYPLKLARSAELQFEKKSLVCEKNKFLKINRMSTNKTLPVLNWTTNKMSHDVIYCTIRHC